MGPDPSAAAAAAVPVPLAARMEFLEPSGLASPVRPERAPAALERAAPVPTGDRDTAQAVARPTEAKSFRESQVANRGQGSPETRWSRDSRLAGLEGRWPLLGRVPTRRSHRLRDLQLLGAPGSIRVHRAAPPRTADACRRKP